MWLFHSSLASHVDRETYIREKYVTDAAEDIVPTSKRNVQHSRKAWLVLYLEPPNHPSQVLTQKALNTHTLVTSYHPSSHSSGLPSVRSTWCRIIAFSGPSILLHKVSVLGNEPTGTQRSKSFSCPHRGLRIVHSIAQNSVFNRQ
jgi:hypothetical protein